MAQARKQISSFTGQHAYLSNFHMSSQPVILDNLIGFSVEHVFQAAKTIDPAEQDIILSQPTPGLAKRAGRAVTLRSNWDELRLGIMVAAIHSKFSDERLKTSLLSTQDADLFEGNHWHDTFWGVCTCATHQNQGQNWLGIILMLERSRLLLLR